LAAAPGCRAEVAFVSLTEAVGATKLAPGSVTSDAIYASKELWAKLAAFASVTTDMLTAGKATITGDAVVGNLKGNNIFGSKIVGSSMYAYSESAESLNKKGLPYKAVDADEGDWNSQAIPMTRVWANRYGASDGDGVCTIASASDTEMTGKYTSRLDFTYNACWETYVDLPAGDVFDATLDFWVADTSGTSEMEIVLLRDGIELSRNRTLDGWQTISIANWKKGDAGTRRYYLRIFPLYSPTNVSFKNLKLWYRTVYDTSSIRLKGNSLLFRQSRPDDKGTNSWFRFTNGQMYAAGTNQLEYQRPLKSLVMPPHFIGTTNQQRILQRNYWEWWPGKLQNDTEWFEYDAQDFRIGKNNIPQAVYSGLYWVTIQVTVSSHYSSLWTTLLVEMNPAGNWDLAVGNSVALEPGVKGVKVSAAGLMQLRTNVRLYWHFAIRTPDMGSENGWLELNNMRLSAMYISN